MGKLLALASCCCILLAATHRIRAEQDEIDSKEEDGLKEFYIRKLYAKVLARRALILGDSVKIESEPEPVSVPVPEAALIHDQLQNKLGWGGGGDDGNFNRNQQGPPGGFQQAKGPSQQYGPPPSQQYGPPPPPPNEQYGPPNQQYGPPPPPPNQNYGPPPPNQNYGPPPPPPNQNYGPPPPPPNQNYGPPPPPPNQNYGPPPSPPNQNYGPPPPPPNQNYRPPSQPPKQNYGPPGGFQQSSGPSQQYGPPPNQQYSPPPSQQYGPPQQQQPSQEYGPPQQSQEYGPPPQPNQLRVNQGNFGGHIENFKINEAVKPNQNSGFKESSQPQDQYGPPSFNDNNNIDNFKNSGGSDRNAKIYKHVYIHTPPPENNVPEKRVIKPNKKQDTHYQIIFVKAPSPPQVQTEIEIPPAPERKTLVYVLVKRPEKSEIKFRPPPPTQPPKPEVYFIRYKNRQNQHGGSNNNGGGYSNSNDNNDFQLQNFQDDLQTQAPLLGGNNDLGNDGYQNEIDSNVEVFNNGMSDLVRNALQSGRDTATGSYPNTEYRAQPNMLGPNQEPMSIAVYDKVRNSVTPNPRRADALLAASSNTNINISQLRKSRRQKQQGSHYTAPGSKPFVKPSGKMVNGHYIGMTSQVLRSKYYTPGEDENDEGYQPI